MNDQGTLRATDFTDDRSVQEITARARSKHRGRVYSDLVDDDEHQYVDLVMEGGGVLGVALLGYIHVLEEAGLRFLNIGGTSAGSIAAMLLAGLGSRGEAKSMRIAQELANVDMNEFVDGPWMVRRFINELLGRRRLIVAAPYYVGVRRGFVRKLGMNPGKRFLEWMTGILEDAGVSTTRDLDERLRLVPDGFRHRDGSPLEDAPARARIGIITAEIGTSTKVELPRMAVLFWQEPESLSPAVFVRTSMSVPFFFHPYRVEDIPQGDAAEKAWDVLVSYDEAIPDTATFVDGGIMSNFPIDIFHRHNRVPSAPTFGVKLGTGKRRVREIGHPAGLGLAAFNSARHCLDYDFIKRNPDYRQLVSHIDTGDHNWLDFNLTRDAKIDLFRRGAVAADRFLTEFDWEDYKALRRELVKVST